jgi:hypothetical protein
MNQQPNPYHACESCQDLGDCPYPEVADDMMGSDLCPDVCPRPIEIMAATLKKRKKLRNRENDV